MNQTKEKQYQPVVNMHNLKGPIPMSIRAGMMYRIDPKLLAFTFARHKFVAKMLDGYQRVVAFGCGDGFADRLVQQGVQELHACDFDSIFIENAKTRIESEWPITFAVHDILSGPYQAGGLFDAAYSLDVIEHIPPQSEHLYMENISQSLKPGGVFICGSPSLESQLYASEVSAEGHINCKRGPELKNLLREYFDHTFLFSMNDEVVHTGYSPMSHYNFVLASGNKIKN